MLMVEARHGDVTQCPSNVASGPTTEDDDDLVVGWCKSSSIGCVSWGTHIRLRITAMTKPISHLPYEAAAEAGMLEKYTDATCAAYPHIYCGEV